MGDPTPTRMTIPNLRSETGKVQQRLLAQVREHGYSEHAQFAIRLALDEALANAIHHGNQDDPSKKVVVEFTVTEEEVHITVTDEGCGFNPQAIPDCTTRRNLMKPNGRGIMLMRSYMTQVDYNCQGNCVHMVKRRDCQLPVQAQRRA